MLYSIFCKMLSRRLQRLPQQGWLEDIPPSLLTCAEEEGA
jgi:hypothetical protein